MARRAPRPAADRHVPVPAATIQLPNSPDPVARPRLGEAIMRAQQMAERAIAAGAVDAPGVAANPGELPGESVIYAERALGHARVPGEIGETVAAGLVLAEEARRGTRVTPLEQALTSSVEGLSAELARAREIAAAAQADHAADRRVLAGEEMLADGTRRPGLPIAPEERRLRRRIRTEEVRAALPLLVPLTIEGAAVTVNMHSYLRVDDGMWWMAVAIALITIGVLTFAPFLIGTALNDLAHGAHLTRMEQAGLALLALVWTGAGTLLALIRVQVDRAEAIRVAEERHRSDVELAQQLGRQVDDIPPVDAGAVFDPVLPTLFWITVFIGFGVVLIWWERTHRNPVRLQELRNRLRVEETSERVLLLSSKLVDITASVELQRRSNEIAVQMWHDEHGVIDATAETRRAAYHATLGEASRDPAMPPAIEQHKADAARRAAEAAAEAESEGEGR